MYKERVKLYEQLEKLLNSKVLVYVTSTRANKSGQIAPDVIKIFEKQLEKIGHTAKISLILHTNGGDPFSAKQIADLIKIYCDEFQVIIPRFAASAGTLLSLSSNEIFMTEKSVITPCDATRTFNYSNSQSKVISVEEFFSYIRFFDNELVKFSPEVANSVFNKINELYTFSEIAALNRQREQTKLIVSSFLKLQISDKEKRKQTTEFLCGGAGSHDYPIHRKEAKEDLFLNIKYPNDDLSKIIEDIYNDLDAEFLFDLPFIPTESMKEYNCVIACVESIKGECDQFVEKGNVIVNNSETGSGITPNVTFVGWQHISENKD